MSRITLLESSAYCHAMMRTAARNFYYGMSLLPETKRRGMFALYSYMRLIDDIADDPDPGNDHWNGQPTDIRSIKRNRLEQWRSLTHAAAAGNMADHPIWPALSDTLRRFHIPIKLFDDAIDGQLQDLDQNSYVTFPDLYQYCYRVASTVGIAAIYIWGFQDERAIQLAEQRGIALQMTNILRDVREDALRGRRYLPDEDCVRFGLAKWNFSDHHVPAEFDELILFQANRTRDYYEQSAPLEGMISPDSRVTLRIMTAIYRGILDRILLAPRIVLSGHVGLSGFEKIAIVARQTWLAQMAAIKGLS